MSTNAQITVCLPVFNARKYIEAAINSVLQQSYENWELVIADNCSDDGTRDVVEQFRDRDPRIRTFLHSTNIGMVANWNFVLSQVKTPFFCLLAGDDYFHPSHLRRKLEILEAEPRAAFVNSAVEIIDANDTLMQIYTEALAHFEKSSAVVTRFFKSNIVNIAGRAHSYFIRENVLRYEVRSAISTSL